MTDTHTQIVRFDYGRPGVTHQAEFDPVMQIYHVLCMGSVAKLSRWHGPVTCKTCLRLLAERKLKDGV